MSSTNRTKWSATTLTNTFEPARPGMNASPSSFYPPRAKWYHRGASRCFRLQRRLHLYRVGLPGEISFLRLAAGLVVPGSSWLYFGHPIWGFGTLGVWGLSALVFLATLGYTASFVAFGLMIAAHVVSVLFLFQRLFADEPALTRRLVGVMGSAAGVGVMAWLIWEHFDYFLAGTLGLFVLVLVVRMRAGVFAEYGLSLEGVPLRVVLAAATLFCYTLGLYHPFLDFMGTHLLLPLRVDKKVIVVNCLGQPWSVRRGDYVAYQVPYQSIDYGVYIQAGYGFEPVLALPGDTVHLTPDHFEVNQQSYPLRPHMPASGDWVVPEKHWFIWPRVAIEGHGHIAQETIDNLVRQAALVGEKQWIGRPFRSWFGRRQIWP